MTDIIVQTPVPMGNPLWKIPEDRDYAFVDLLREVCLKIKVEAREHKIQFEGEDVILGKLCLNLLSRGDQVSIVSR